MNFLMYGQMTSFRPDHTEAMQVQNDQSNHKCQFGYGNSLTMDQILARCLAKIIPTLKKIAFQ